MNIVNIPVLMCGLRTTLAQRSCTFIAMYHYYARAWHLIPEVLEIPSFAGSINW
ncbi:hypothetical protein MH117_08275 [Paenibacillus sp. ACRRX]|nr:hypothetical protein [Paenibacillus sp. ACRRX]